MATTAAAAAPTPQQVAEAFLKMYTTTFSGKRADLGNFYQDASTMSFEGTTVKGKAAIAGVLAKIPIPAGVAHRLVTTDLQPSPSPGAVVVMVTGDIASTKFQQVFQLVPAGGNYYIHNDLFRAGTTNPDNAPKEAGGEVAKLFVQHYYNTFDGASRGELAKLYSAASMLTMEDKTFTGPEAILERLKQLPATAHVVQTLDVQSVSGDDKVLMALVTGEIQIEGSDNKLKFTQCFQLIKNGASYYVHNDLFRFNYG